MKSALAFGIVAFLLVLPLAFAEKTTHTLEFSLAPNATTVTTGNSHSFYKNVNISSWKSLHDYTLWMSVIEGTTYLNVSINGIKCSASSDAYVTKTYTFGNPTVVVCTDALTANLTGTVVNVTISNVGDTTTNISSIMQHFTVDVNTSLEVYPLTQAQLDQLEADINASISNANSSIWSRIGLVVTDVFSKIMTNGQTYQSFSQGVDANLTAINKSLTTEIRNVNASVNSTSNLTAAQVWNYVIGSGKTADVSLSEVFKWRWAGLANTLR